MKLHEILAIEKNVHAQLNVLIADTIKKFSDSYLFKGWTKRLKLLKESSDNEAIESAGSETREIVTTVKDTLTYMLAYWAKSEDIQFKKNQTNQHASADIYWQGTVLVSSVPVDELMGLESRLTKLREVFQLIPTLDPTRSWEVSSIKTDIWKSVLEDVTTKTEKILVPIVLYAATDKHPAQVKEVSKDEIIGTFNTTHFSGAITSKDKAALLERIDNLISEVKQARMRANMTEVVQEKIGTKLVEFILEPLQ